MNFANFASEDRTRPSRTTPAFTLIELLVVITVIVLLISILLPVLGNAREAGRRVKCASNLRQVGVYRAVFSAENHERLWPTYYIYNDGGTPTTEFWWSTIYQVHFGQSLMSLFARDIHDYPYQYPVFLCPSSPAAPGVRGTPGAGVFNSNMECGDYAGHTEIRWSTVGSSGTFFRAVLKTDQV